VEGKIAIERRSKDTVQWEWLEADGSNVTYSRGCWLRSGGHSAKWCAETGPDDCWVEAEAGL
jgi:hypothetical protein